MIKLTENVFAVEVPEGLVQPWYQTERSISAIIEGRVEDEELVIRHIERKCGSPTGKITIKLPPGTWQLLCTMKEASEEQAKGVVEYDKFIEGYKDYDTDNFHHDTPFIKALDSLRSLLASKGLDLNQNYCLLKKIR